MIRPTCEWGISLSNGCPDCAADADKLAALARGNQLTVAAQLIHKLWRSDVSCGYYPAADLIQVAFAVKIVGGSIQ